MNDRPEKLIHVIQGEYAVADNDETVLTALLGSCVAACIRDPIAGVGGINHFLLPDTGSSSGNSNKVVYGAQSMELLLNALMKKGALKSRMEAKLFGGASVLGGRSEIGKENGEFARRFLQDEGIPCVAESLGGNEARRIRFWPVSGRARQMLLGESPVREAPPPPPKPVVDDGNDVELF